MVQNPLKTRTPFSVTRDKQGGTLEDKHLAKKKQKTKRRHVTCHSANDTYRFLTRSMDRTEFVTPLASEA